MGPIYTPKPSNSLPLSPKPPTTHYITCHTSLVVSHLYLCQKDHLPQKSSFSSRVKEPRLTMYHLITLTPSLLLNKSKNTTPDQKNSWRSFIIPLRHCILPLHIALSDLPWTSLGRSLLYHLHQLFPNQKPLLLMEPIHPWKIPSSFINYWMTGNWKYLSSLTVNLEVLS